MTTSVSTRQAVTGPRSALGAVFEIVPLAGAGAALPAVMLATLALSSSAEAQIAERPSTSETCELHVYPAGNELASVQGAVSLLGLPFNWIDAAAHDKSASRVKAQMSGDLPPAGQVEVLTDGEVLRALKLPAGTVIMAESAIPSQAQLQSDPAQKARLAAMNTAIHERRRLSASTTPCYAELVASNVFVQRDPVSGTRLRVRWYFRNLGANPNLALQYDGWSEVQIAGYTTTTPEQLESARTALRKAFLISLVTWAAANLDKHSEPVRQHANPPGH